MIKGHHPLGPRYEFSPFVVENCRPGAKAATCRYLTGDLGPFGGGLHCGKSHPALRARIDERVADGTMIAVGDNCPGRPYEEVL
jgi:hypothetical protein